MATLTKITAEPVAQGAPMQLSVAGLDSKRGHQFRATQFGFDNGAGGWWGMFQNNIKNGTLTIDSPDNLTLDPRYGYDWETNPEHARPYVQAYICDSAGNLLAPFVEFVLGPAV